MALGCKVGSFDVNTSTGSQAITDLGFQPEWVWFLSTGQTAYNSFSADMDISTGWDGNTANVYWQDAGQSIQKWYGTGSEVFANRAIHKATLTSYDADGFTINVTTAPGTATKVSYLAVGGTASHYGTRNKWLLGDTSFTDTTVLVSPHSADLFINFATYYNRFSDGRDEGEGRISFGWATSALGDDMSVSQGTPNVDPLDVAASLYDNRCIRFSSPATSAFSGTATFDAHVNTLDTGLGITYDDPPDVNLDGLYVWKVLDLSTGTSYTASGYDTQKTSTGTKSTSLGFRPKAVIFGTVADTTRNSTATDGALCIGFSDGTNQAAIFGGGEGGSTHNTNRRHSNTKCLMMADYTDTVNAEATCTFTGDGFTLDWTTADATARDFIYLAFSDELGADFIPQIYRRL